MTGKDPKDMTASELLRKAGNGYEGASGTVMMNLIDLMGLSRKIRHSECLYALADKIDAELAQARELSLLRGAELWAKANGWPDFREGEDFGAWLNRCAIRIPCFEDGEPLTPGDGFIQKYTGECTCKGFSVAVFSNESCGNAVWHPGELVKRPAHEVLGADGKPIKGGETVWGILSGSKGIVNFLNDDTTAYVEWDDGRWSPSIYCCNLTHTPPDTQERIDDDAEKFYCAYFGGYGACGTCPASAGELSKKSCKQQQILDLLRRQRELDAQKGGE